MSELVKEKDLCDKLKLSRSTLYRLRQKGLPYSKVGGSIRYNLGEVTKWINENK